MHASVGACGLPLPPAAACGLPPHLLPLPRRRRLRISSHHPLPHPATPCHTVPLQLELTLVALTARPLPLAAARGALSARLEASMARLSGQAELAPQHKADLADFVSKFEGGCRSLLSCC